MLIQTISVNPVIVHVLLVIAQKDSILLLVQNALQIIISQHQILVFHQQDVYQNMVKNMFVFL